MEFIQYLLSGIIDSFVLIIMVLLSPLIRIIDSKKLNTFIEDILTEIFIKEGLF